jgi:hypothetical protein
MVKNRLIFAFVYLFATAAAATDQFIKPIDMNLMPEDLCRIDTTRCKVTQNLIDPVYHEGIKTTKPKGYCLEGVRKLLNKVLPDGDWNNQATHAYQYVGVIEKSGKFKQIPCHKDLIATDSYKPGTIVIYDRHPGCTPKLVLKKDGKTKCSYSGHIMVKLSNTEEFSGNSKRSLEKWNYRYGDKCWTFVPKDAVMLDIEPSEKLIPGDVCWPDAESLVNSAGVEPDYKIDGEKNVEDVVPTKPPIKDKKESAPAVDHARQKRIEAAQDSAKRLREMESEARVRGESVWKTEEGNFNYTRLASDAVAGAVVGTAGGLIVHSIIKQSQAKSGFEDIQCSVNGKSVADWEDEFKLRSITPLKIKN